MQTKTLLQSNTPTKTFGICRKDGAQRIDLCPIAASIKRERVGGWSHTIEDSALDAFASYLAASRPAPKKKKRKEKKKKNRTYPEIWTIRAQTGHRKKALQQLDS